MPGDIPENPFGGGGTSTIPAGADPSTYDTEGNFIGSPDGNALTNSPMADFEFTGGVSQLNGQPVIRWRTGPNNSQQATLETIKKFAEDRGLSEDQINDFFQGKGVETTVGSDGKITFGSITFTNSRGQEQTFGGSSGNYTRSQPSTGGRINGSGGGGGGGGGGPAQRGSPSSPRASTPRNDTTSSPSTSTTTGGIAIDGTGNGAPGGPPIDPNAAAGIDFGAAAGSASAGDRRFNDPNVFSTPDSFTDGLDENSSLNDILLGAAGEERASRDSALGISGGLASSFEDNALRQATEAGARGLVANPFSLDDRTIQRIQGQQTELIGRNAERLQQSAADRAASSGISRSGINQSNQGRIDLNAAQQIGASQRGLLVEQATRRPQEIASALQTGANVFGSQQGQRQQIAEGAINTLNQTDVSADAAVLGTLASGGVPQVNIGGRNQYQDSREGVGNFNPF